MGSGGASRLLVIIIIEDLSCVQSTRVAREKGGDWEVFNLSFRCVQSANMHSTHVTSKKGEELFANLALSSALPSPGLLEARADNVSRL